MKPGLSQMRPAPRHNDYFDRNEILNMLGDALLPDLPDLEAVLDRIERRGGAR